MTDLAQEESLAEYADCASNDASLHKQEHIEFVTRGINCLSRGFTSLDASQAWLVYWNLRSLNLMGANHDKYFDAALVKLKHMQHRDGGFGGGSD